MPKVQKKTDAARKAVETPKRRGKPKGEGCEEWTPVILSPEKRNTFDDGRGHYFFVKSSEFRGRKTDLTLTPVHVKSILKGGKVVVFSRRVAQDKYNAYMLAKRRPPRFFLDSKDYDRR